MLMLQVFSGFGMRIAFVDEDDVTEEPEIVARNPDDQSDFRPYEIAAARAFPPSPPPVSLPTLSYPSVAGRSLRQRCSLPD